MIQTAGHHCTIPQHPNLVPQAVAEAWTVTIGGGQIGPVELFSPLQKNAWSQGCPTAPLLPWSGEGLFQRRQNSVIQLVCSLRIWAVQIPQSQRAPLPRLSSPSGENDTTLQIIRQPCASIRLKGVERNAHLLHCWSSQQSLALLPE